MLQAQRLQKDKKLFYISIDDLIKLTNLVHSNNAKISLSIGGATYPFNNSDLYSKPGDLANNINKMLNNLGIQNITNLYDGIKFIEELEKAKGSKILVINALRKTSHVSHFNLAEALEVIEKINPEKAYITHLSHMMGLHAEVQAELPEHVFLAQDGLKIII